MCIRDRYDDDHVIDLPKEIFMIEGEFDSDRVVEGAVIPLMTSEAVSYTHLDVYKRQL